nr:immunoglobulin light chain junction region [Macaca mulatta]MPN80471.1 immunoglobulin light chain junction region [Macaca mulatta]MPN80482.1 immunoglobulin light chain junction region [Macaca mulatta]MPN81257.1 immunoglobulin light chain junction region [Macaca mulatta]
CEAWENSLSGPVF